VPHDMKHNIKITTILLCMFLLTQFIGLYVVSQYMPEKQTIFNNQTNSTQVIQNYSEANKVPYGMQPEEGAKPNFFSIIISFVFAISLVLIIMKYKWKLLIRTFFFIVITIAIAITINSILKNYVSLNNSIYISLAIAFVFSLAKAIRPSFVIHNFTEFLIYPGIAPMFVILFTPLTMIIMLIIISIYDMWAVWHSGIMQKMAKFQIEEVGIFGGFFIPYLTKKVKEKIALLKKSKSKKKIKMSIAMLGGGDIIFPIITAGVFLRDTNIYASLAVILGAFLGLLFLLFFSEKKKFYPAMPFITAGIFLGLLIWKIFNLM